MVAKRGHTNRANIHTPVWKSNLKHNAAEFQSIQQFWLKKNPNNAGARVWGDTRGDQKHNVPINCSPLPSPPLLSPPMLPPPPHLPLGDCHTGIDHIPTYRALRQRSAKSQDRKQKIAETIYNLKLIVWSVMDIVTNTRLWQVYDVINPKPPRHFCWEPSKILQHPVKRYPNCWTLMELVQWQMQNIHGLAIHSTEFIKSSRWSLMDLVHGATCSIRWAILWSTESIKSSQWSLMDLVHMATCSIRWAILWSTESIKSSRWSLMDLVHGATCSIRWAILWSTESIKSSRWSLMDLVHMATCSIHWAILWSTESNKSSRWSLMDLVHMATCSIHWAILWSTESNKSSRWSLIDLVHMATYSIRWAILWSTESIKIRQNQVVDLDGLRVVRVNVWSQCNTISWPKYWIDCLICYRYFNLKKQPLTSLCFY